MLAAMRQTRILEEVKRSGAVRVSDLTRLLGVSDMTVRRDLETLSRQGLLSKVHGGATSTEYASTDEPGFAAKSERAPIEKEAIAVHASRLVQPGTAVALTAGSDTLTVSDTSTGAELSWLISTRIVLGPPLTNSPRPEAGCPAAITLNTLFDGLKLMDTFVAVKAKPEPVQSTCAL